MSVETIRALPENLSISKEVLKPASWFAHIDFVNHLILENNVLISFLGEQGSGKTTFSHLLQTDCSSEIKSCLLTANALFDGTHLLIQLGRLLEMEGELSISNFMAQSNEQQCHTLIIIDDAHYLSTVFIEDILKALLQQNNNNYFHVCLVSGFSLVPTLNQFAQDTYTDMIHSIELGPLNESETKVYVEQNRLLKPGAKQLISDSRIKQFYQLTEGRIVAINRQMNDFFSYKAIKPLNQAKLFRQTSIAASIFMAGIGIGYIWLSQGNESPPAQVASLVTPSPILISDGLNDAPMSSDIPAYSVAVTRQALQATSLRQVGLASAGDENNTLNESLVVMDKVVVAPKIIQLQVKSKVVVIKKPSHITSKASLKPIQKAVVIKSKIEKNRYTIQLIAGHNKSKLTNFVQDHHLNGKVHVRQTKLKGAVWYILTLGEYTQRQHAKQAVDHLPKDIAQFKPWVRLISDLT